MSAWQVHRSAVLRMQAGDRSARRSFPVTSRKPDGLCWAIALDRAGGDASRLEVTADGSVIIRNRPARGR